MEQTLRKEGRLILLLGGARGGKSAYALSLAQDAARSSKGDVCFIHGAGPDEDM